MNFIKIIGVAVLLSLTFTVTAQSTFPASTVVDENGENVDLEKYLKDGNPKIISLWATWCGPCRMELNALKDSYPKWKEKYNLEIVTVSVDVPQMVARAKKMFAANGWEYTFLHDKNQELMSKLQINGIPYSMLLDGQGNVVSVQMGYSSAYERQIEQKLKAM